HETRIGLLPPTPEQKDGRLITVLVNGEDVSWQIRSVEVSKLVPQVAAMPTVRQKLVILQQEMARTNNVVMEGRDITYRVLPNANLKIYLTASDEVRALRRHEQLLQKGEEVALSDVAADLHSRDEMDMQRITDPLKIVAGAWVLDTSTLTIDQVVDLICEKARSLMET
ncbi:cytidylate kinase, partial [Microgenomates group bacterium RIFCSPLOWO2_01_FULL_47_10]